MTQKSFQPTGPHAARPRRRRLRRAVSIAMLAAFPAAMSAPAQRALIAFASQHSDPAYVAQHVQLIESRPFDGLVINDYLGRNLLNTRLAADAPAALDPGGVITYEAAARGLAPVKGIFKRFQSNFAKVNFNMVGAPPLLSDDARWRVALESAANYARAVRDARLKGIFFDNETYLRPAVPGRSGGADYWQYEDQLLLGRLSPSALPLSAAVALARRRGFELMRAFARGYPDITVIAAHGPYEGCSAWMRSTGAFGADSYLLGAFVAGMVEGRPDGATLVDGGENYDLRSAHDFAASRTWRQAGASDHRSGITSLDSGGCPFMDAALAAHWQLSIAFSTFDKERASQQSNNWTPTKDTARFRVVLANALRASDGYVWHYTEWQDWWSDSMDEALRPWIDAIGAARRDAGM